MSNQSTFRSYWKHLWSNHLHQAKPWARDQILWALVVIIVIPFLAALRVGKKIDAPFIWTCLEFYFVVAVIYAAVHVLRAGWKAYQERDRVIGERDGHIQRLGEIMTERANQAQQQSFQHSCEIARANRLQKELNEARVDLINAKDKLESLTWPNDRPKLSFHSWGKIKPEFAPGGTNNPMVMAQHGFYIANDGGAALEITVESFVINSDFIAIGGTLSRIEANDNGFVPVRIKDEVPLSQWDLDIALEKAWCEKADRKEIDLESKEPLELCVSVIYRDYSHLWYRSKGMLRFFFDHYDKSRIEFSAVQQEKHGVCKPILRDL